MSARQLGAVAYLVLALGVAIAWTATANDLAPFRDPTPWPYVWMAFPFGLAAVATWAMRGSRAALALLLPVWIVCVVGGSWIALYASYVVVSDMSGLLLYAPPYLQTPIVILASAAAWWRRTRRP